MNINKQEFEALFNNASIGIVIVNHEGTIVLVNQFVLNKFGYNSENIIGKKIEILIPQRYKQVHQKHRNTYFKHSNPQPRSMGIGLDLYGIKKDGKEFPVEVSLSSYTTTEGTFSVAFISDITIRKDAEQALIQLNEKLEQKVKDRTHSLEIALEKEKELNELKSRFVSMASHEFRTPLSSILSSVYLISQYIESADQPKREKHIQRIVQSVNMLVDTLNDFLAGDKIKEGKIQVTFTELNIKNFILAFINEMQPVLKNEQTIKYTHTGEERVSIDVTLLKHVLMNLVSNAIKFSSENSIITINSNNHSSLLTLYIKDEGIGISEEDRKHLFQRFFRGSNVSNIQGTGLGLHNVAKYLELMNGSISCQSELYKGTQFLVELKQKV